MPTAFITKAAIKTRMLIDPTLEGVDEGLDSAIIASQLRIEAYLDSQIEQKTYTNIFFLDSQAYSDIQPNGFFRCYLKTGGVDTTVPLVLLAGGTFSTMTLPVPTTDYYLDAIKGVLYVSNVWQEMFLTVNYTAGYVDATTVPDWLSEALLSYVPVVLNFAQETHKATNRGVEGGFKSSGDHALAILDPYTRNVGFLTRPIF